MAREQETAVPAPAETGAGGTYGQGDTSASSQRSRFREGPERRRKADKLSEQERGRAEDPTDTGAK